jgi:photosystem II stability/assembly factor-like uncharacterized protein
VFHSAFGHLLRIACCVLQTVAASQVAQAQWTVQQSHTTASLRGVHNVGGGVAWASGAEGTILRTTNDGETWQACTVPQGAAKLDFRGIEAFDANTAIVMSAGTGNLSRLYKTTDACQTWKLVFTNPDKKGFWDAFQFGTQQFGVLIGDQVRGRFPVFSSADGGNTWQKLDSKGIAAAQKRQSIFAASNTALLIDGNTGNFYFVTGGGVTTFVDVDPHFTARGYRYMQYGSVHPPLAVGETAGGFSIASRMDGSNRIVVAVGGDYKLPDRTTGTAASWIDDGPSNLQWRASDTPPLGYRSAVAWYPSVNTWIAVGPNGTDFSTDDGLNWHALKPMPGETPDADRNWNALSLPFAVGARGRIGKLSADAFSRKRD